MTILTGYHKGYSFSGGGLTIAANGTIGGSGLTASNAGIYSYGLIRATPQDVDGGDGYRGVGLTASTMLSISDISGGAARPGVGQMGAMGGSGGLGVFLSSSTLSSSGNISGGNGGGGADGGPGQYSPYDGGAGGSGGLGVSLTNDSKLVNTGFVGGGTGGDGAYGYDGGNGGNGGAGVVMAGGALINLGAIAGGGGGARGYPQGDHLYGDPGVGGDGVSVTGGGLIINGSSSAAKASISGQYGVWDGGGGALTVISYGTISGAKSVNFSQSTDRLIAEGGSVFAGEVSGGGGTLDIRGGKGVISGTGGVGTLSGGITMTFAGFGSYAIDGEGSWDIAASGVIGGVGLYVSDATVLNQGHITSDNGSAGLYHASGVGGAGGHGGYGAYLENSTLTNRASISGGAGGAGGGAGPGGQGGAGGDGAAAVNQSASTTSNSGSIFGGAGGVGGPSQMGSGAGAGGAGGDGVQSFTGRVLNTGAITGGAGGAGAAASGGGGGVGGVGGYGVGSTGVLITNGGRITGGAGGAGGAGTSGFTGGAGGHGGTGIRLLDGGELVNTGTVAGGIGGASGAGAPGATGGTGYGVVVSGGRIFNGAAGETAALISGVDGVYDTGAAPLVITNFGTIAGSAASVVFHQAADRLIAEAGSQFHGLVKGGGGALELAGGAGSIAGLGASGTLTGAVGMTFQGFGSYRIDAGAWTLTGDNVLAAGHALISAGTITNKGSLALDGNLTSTGILSNAAGAVISLNGDLVQVEGTFANAGTLALAGAGTSTSLRLLAATTLTGGGQVTLAGAADRIFGAAGATALTNINNTISGGGNLGLGTLVLDNAAKGVIEGTGTVALTIYTGANTIANAGTLIADSAQGLRVASALLNTGTLEVMAGVLTLNAAVSGGGSALIDAGTLWAASAFSENVAFSGTAAAKLVLARSRSYGGSLTGFSLHDALDLGDIPFASGVTSASFKDNGHGTAGVLTVKNGAAVATINLIGDYLGKSFTVATDSHAGTLVREASTLAAAMAGFSPSPAWALPAADAWQGPASGAMERGLARPV